MSATDRLLDRRFAMLLVIDVQERINAVMADQGHVPRIAALVDGCRALEIPVVATEQYPKGLGSTVERLGECLRETPVAKDTFSCAREAAVRSALEDAGRVQVIVTGIETHVCVLQTVIDLSRAGYEVHVPHDAVNSRRNADRDWALRRMEASGAVITSTESALFELLERCDTQEFKKVAGLIKKIPVE
jgi:nicotinamidase-related amidase